MKKDFSYTFKNLDGSPVLIENDAPLTLQFAAITALHGQYRDEQNIAATEKIRRHLLAVKVFGGGEVDLPAEDIALLKTLINKAFGSPLVVAQAWEYLDA